MWSSVVRTQVVSPGSARRQGHAQSGKGLVMASADQPK
ncbi:hypothetical protein DVS28_a0464 [Euzebya pacifica]|uniref:Uncharacterized protein n=1 Tax=Euzebya pacifica TaxID=1608957 RepID=A0A346XSH4_9ACTN|nr:hypothetical protein DVS28_a0464 [Euzebya pacifica]